MPAARSAMHRPMSLVGVLALVAVLLPTTSAAAFDDGSFDASIACPADAVPAGRFTDAGATHGNAVRCLAWYGIVRGKTPTTFQPDASITRGQTATMAVNLLRRLSDVQVPAPTSNVFGDIAGTTHQAAIETLAAFDPPIVSGLDGTTFDPGGAVTRGQFSSILTRLLDEVAGQRDGLQPLPAGQPRFADAAGNVHEPAISRLNEVGVIGGFPDGTFRPNASITRGQGATLLAGAMGGLADAGLLPQPDPIESPDLDVALRLTQVASVASVTSAAAGPDGTLYIGERGGTVRPLTSSGAGSPVIDISDRVSGTGEGGLLGLAFAANGAELYLSYTDRNGDTAIDAVPVVDGRFAAEQRRSVYATSQPASNHNGGDIQVGPDGLLYIALGDGGGGGDPFENGQDLATPLGAMLRIDPQGASPYAVPSDNPFVGQSGALDEIYAYGLRNPWRFSFDRDTGDLYIADVGQSTREEINHLRAGTGAGANFGWNLMEGTVPFQGGTEPAGHVAPVYEYATGGGEGCSITGGFVYRGQAIPELRGAYLYSDFCNPAIRAIVVDGGAVVDQGDLGIRGSQVVSFAQDGDGELYVLNLGGEVQRIDPA
jgi:glucose/arabinose dehydrogenase